MKKQRGHRPFTLLTLLMLVIWAGAFVWLPACASAPRTGVSKTVAVKTTEPRTELLPQLIDPARHPLYPVDRYITAIGRSGESIDQAEDHAKLKVSEQVSSRIESIFRQQMTEEFNKVSWQIQKDTRFLHAEMIHIDTASSAKRDGMYLAFAYLSREELYQVQAMEYENHAVKFRQEVESPARLQNDLSAYTTALRAAQKSFDRLANKAFEIQAVTLKTHPPFAQDVARLRVMESHRVAVLRDLKLTIMIEGTQRGQIREVILMALTGALARLDLEAAPGACEPQKYALLIRADVDCRRGYLGQECLLKMKGALIHCASGDVLTEVDLSTAEFKGVHSKEIDKALARLYDSVNPDVLTPMLYHALRDSLPIDVRTERDSESYL